MLLEFFEVAIHNILCVQHSPRRVQCLLCCAIAWLTARDCMESDTIELCTRRAFSNGGASTMLLSR